jgi:hypothetical protein
MPEAYIDSTTDPSGDDESVDIDSKADSSTVLVEMMAIMLARGAEVSPTPANAVSMSSHSAEGSPFPGKLPAA